MNKIKPPKAPETFAEKQQQVSGLHKEILPKQMWILQRNVK